MGILEEGVYTLVRNGLVEIIVFALVFAVVFGILQKIKFLAKGKDGDYKEGLKKVKSIHTIIALVMGALVILPHYVSRYSSYDIIPVIEQAFPKLSLLLIALIGVFVVLGMVGLKISGGKDGNPLRPIIFLVLVGIVIWIFGGSINYWRIPYWLSPDIIAVIVAVIAFGLVVSFIMGPSEKKKSKDTMWDNFKDIIEETGKKKPKN